VRDHHLIGLASGRALLVSTSVALLVAMVLTAVIAWALLRRGLRLTRIEGAVLLAVYLVILPIVLTG